MYTITKFGDIVDEETRGHASRTLLLRKELDAQRIAATIVDVPSLYDLESAIENENIQGKLIVIHDDWAQRDFIPRATMFLCPTLAKPQMMVTRSGTMCLRGRDYALIPDAFKRIKYKSGNKLVGIAAGSAEEKFFAILESAFMVSRGAVEFIRLDDNVSQRTLINRAKKCKFVIAAGGVTSQELNSLGIPMLLVETAENQIPNISAMLMHNVARMFNSSNLSHYIKNTLDQPESLATPENIENITAVLEGGI